MIYTLNNIQFEVKNQQILVTGQVVHLSPRGHQCLLLFLASGNQILSKEYLLKTLWQNVIVSDDSLFKVIQEIRKVLRLTGLNDDVITNVYGRGYQLQAAVTTVSSHFIKPYLIWVLPLILITILIIIMIREPQPQISDEAFDRQVEILESNLRLQLFDKNVFKVDRRSHPSDQLKKAYLHGLERYKSGDYDRSISELLAGIKAYGNEESNKILADAYLLLSKMFIYRSDKDTLQRYLNQAEFHYAAADNQAGMISTAISRARYHQAVFQFPESIVLLDEILAQASLTHDTYNQMRALSNLAYSYQQSNKPDKYQQSLEQTLTLALQIADGNYAAYAYGALSQLYMEQANFTKAMKFAQQALKYVLKQQDTNNFQQGYSAFYNLLQELGHIELAEIHLQSAIDIQAHFNSESLLVLAEINLAKVNMTLGQFIKSSEILKKLLTTELSTNEQLEVTALRALNSYYQQDNITAYTESKRVFESDNGDTRTLLIAGMALSLSSHQLERSDEAIKVFNAIKPLANQDWLFVHTQFLQLAQIVYAELTPNEAEHIKWIEAKTSYERKRQAITDNTQADTRLMNDLNIYINQILK